ncbi:dCTP deaminase [Symmachiella dynata]|uniref:dCTP deaminase n=1 Tax=Symmachiella dynata TaxID=2527995 RepID=UPI0030ECCE54|tara:strand:- start:655 stop:1263 length:609 start_codon:yes stop_codon:yes gene_type:complete
MILSNVEIHKALDDGRLVIKPEPGPRLPTIGKHCPYGTHTVDLTLASELSIPKDDFPIAFDLSNKKKLAECLAQNSEKCTITEDQPYTLKQGKFILAKTRETIELPMQDPGSGARCLAARIEGKSSRARLGLLVHFTAPTVHPGFSGTLTLEIINLGPAKILLSPGVAIAQLIVEEVVGIPLANPSQFQGQSSPEGVLNNGA